jgi:glycine/D-amino acid oxidase-like deaminating enzyme
MARQSIAAFEHFHANLGHVLGVQQAGAYLIARRDETAAQLRRWSERAKRFGVVSEVISPASSGC